MPQLMPSTVFTQPASRIRYMVTRTRPGAHEVKFVSPGEERCQVRRPILRCLLAAAPRRRPAPAASAAGLEGWVGGARYIHIPTERATSRRQTVTNEQRNHQHMYYPCAPKGPTLRTFTLQSFPREYFGNGTKSQGICLAYRTY